MNRPYYENEATLAVEAETMMRLADIIGLDYQKLGIKYGVDFALLAQTGLPHPRHKVAAWVECKRRNYQRSSFPTFMLSMHKWLKGRELSHETVLPFIIAVEWNDGIYTVNAAKVVNSLSFYIGIGGREDRDDQQDMEPCIFIPVGLFEKARA